jgi:predicted short-subunit dehydrogenase-like oxidoreductase (DUF2520 family)
MKIVLIGSGNLSSHLGLLLRKNGHSILQIVGRSEKSTQALAQKMKCDYTLDLASVISKADVYLIAVPDHEINTIIKKFPYKDKVIAHTSGSITLSAFPPKFLNAGVFYPLQTFSTQHKLVHAQIPVCIEGRSKIVNTRLKKLALSITDKAVTIDSKQRLWLHLSAVLVNNFSNHLFTLSELLLEKHGMNFDILRPLIAETASKVMDASPLEMQTGPARRGDAITIERHLKILGSSPGIQKIYRLLSDSIEELQGPKL